MMTTKLNIISLWLALLVAMCLTSTALATEEDVPVATVPEAIYETVVAVEDGTEPSVTEEILVVEAHDKEIETQDASTPDTIETQADNAEETINGLTPEGNLTLVDDIGSEAAAGQQFLTVQTKSGNYFYIIIDRDEDGSENVYFLNMVDEADLLALMEEEAVAEYQATQSATNTDADFVDTSAVVVAENSVDNTAEDEAVLEMETTEIAEADNTAKGSMSPLVLLCPFLLAGGGAYLFMQSKKRKQTEEKPDPDADYEYEYDGEISVTAFQDFTIEDERWSSDSSDTEPI